VIGMIAPGYQDTRFHRSRLFWTTTTTTSPTRAVSTAPTRPGTDGVAARIPRPRRTRSCRRRSSMAGSRSKRKSRTRDPKDSSARAVVTSLPRRRSGDGGGALAGRRATSNRRSNSSKPSPSSRPRRKARPRGAVAVLAVGTVRAARESSRKAPSLASRSSRTLPRPSSRKSPARSPGVAAGDAASSNRDSSNSGKARIRSDRVAAAPRARVVLVATRRAWIVDQYDSTTPVTPP
jgi:hypothetical protein